LESFRIQKEAWLAKLQGLKCIGKLSRQQVSTTAKIAATARGPLCGFEVVEPPKAA
jgi:hypothetical protein